ncbi:MAG: hypothetical protein MH137_02185 [Flavobacteriales bacterium]|nr:hypothetical protein [Flavobacteriales bacterium]
MKKGIFTFLFLSVLASGISFCRTLSPFEKMAETTVISHETQICDAHLGDVSDNHSDIIYEDWTFNRLILSRTRRVENNRRKSGRFLKQDSVVELVGSFHSSLIQLINHSNFLFFKENNLTAKPGYYNFIFRLTPF